MKLFRWLIKPKHLQKLKDQQNYSLMKIEVDSIKTSCILQISDEIKSHWLSLERLLYMLGVTSIKNNLARITRDGYGNEMVLPIAVFSANQAASIWLNQLKFYILFPIFLGAEANLYYLQAALFVPGASPILKAIVAIFLTLLIMVGLDFGISKYFAYQEGTDKHGKKEITDSHLRILRDFRNLGHAFIALSLAAIVFGAISRLFYLEWIPSKGLDPSKLESIQQASHMASIFTLLVTLITGLYMAMLKYDHRKNGLQFRVLRGWQKAMTQKNQYNQELINHAHTIMLIAEQHARQYWQLVIELKRLFKNEVDPDYGELYEEYLHLKAQPGFTITDHIYLKFNAISHVDEYLFIWGILNCKEIKEKIAYATHILSVPKEHLQEHLTIIDKQGSNQMQKPSNGKAKEFELSTI